MQMRARRGGNSLCGDTFISEPPDLLSDVCAEFAPLSLRLSRAHNEPTRSGAVNILCLALEFAEK
jgi:hypothetical protein